MIELIGDVGSGKTTFTKGLAAGLGCEDDISSPTFTISRVYPARKGLKFHHFDFYRMNGHDITSDELAEVMQQSDAVTVVEWAGSGDNTLPEDRIQIHLMPGHAEDDRQISIKVPNSRGYILEELSQ